MASTAGFLLDWMISIVLELGKVGAKDLEGSKGIPKPNMISNGVFISHRDHVMTDDVTFGQWAIV